MDLLYNAHLTQDPHNHHHPPARFWRGGPHPRGPLRGFLPRPRGDRPGGAAAAAQRRDHNLAQEFIRLHHLMAREQALLAAPPPIATNNSSTALPNALSELTRTLRPIANNDPTVTTYTYDASDDAKMQQINTALKQNTVLQQLHLHPSGWKDLKTIKQLAAIISNHPRLNQVHLYPSHSTRNFVTQLAVDSLMQAFSRNPSITQWCLHLSPQAASSSTLQECIATCPHVETLELHDLPVVDMSSLAAAIAKSPNLASLKLIRTDPAVLKQIFDAAHSENSRLKQLCLESAREAGTTSLAAWISNPTCRLERLTLKSIQTFQRRHADRLVGALTENNNSVKHVAFVDCCFHPEVVRPLQDLVKGRLDLESFQITRCNADPSMALLTVCANVYNGQMTRLKAVTMGFSLGIEDRLGGDAIRSVLRYNSHLQSLNLAGSHRLGETGLRHVARGLGKNQTLRRLDLSHCSITRPSLRLLTQHLAANPHSHLTSLNLSHNALGVQGVQILTEDWLLQPNCVLEELILNRCEIYSQAFMALIRAIPLNTSLQTLQVLECGRLGVNELQELAESLFHLGGLRVLKASCFKSPVQPIRPVQPQVMNPNNNNNARDHVRVFDDNDDDDDGNDSDEEDLELLLEEDAAEMAAVAHPLPPAAAAATTTNAASNNGSMKLLKETFLAGLIHNQQLEHISLTNILECVMKPKDALRVRAWMDFCGKRNLMQPLLQQTNIPLLSILTDVVRECRDPRTHSLTATGLSLQYYCLRNRPDALDRVQRMLTVEAERHETSKVDHGH